VCVCVCVGFSRYVCVYKLRESERARKQASMRSTERETEVGCGWGGGEKQTCCEQRVALLRIALPQLRHVSLQLAPILKFQCMHIYTYIVEYIYSYNKSELSPSKLVMLRSSLEVARFRKLFGSNIVFVHNSRAQLQQAQLIRKFAAVSDISGTRAQSNQFSLRR